MDEPEDDPLALPEALKSTPLPWQSFEAEVAAYLARTVGTGWLLGFDPNACRVSAKRSLHSKDRGSVIEFDVAVEVFATYEAVGDPLIVWLWECKDYPSRRVTGDEVEEFHSKMVQVGAHIGTVVTRFGFQKGAIRYAKSKRIGLMTLNRWLPVGIALSQDAGILRREEITASFCLHTSGESFDGPLGSQGEWLCEIIMHEALAMKKGG